MLNAHRVPHPAQLCCVCLKLFWNQYELRLGVTHETSELRVVLTYDTHAEPCSCVAEDTSVLHALQLIRGQAALRSSAGQYTLTRHALASDADHNAELSSDAPHDNPSSARFDLLRSMLEVTHN